MQRGTGLPGDISHGAPVEKLLETIPSSRIVLPGGLVICERGSLCAEQIK